MIITRIDDLAALASTTLATYETLGPTRLLESLVPTASFTTQQATDFDARFDLLSQQQNVDLNASSASEEATASTIPKHRFTGRLLGNESIIAISEHFWRGIEL